jgi:hypothetical protein
MVVAADADRREEVRRIGAKSPSPVATDALAPGRVEIVLHSGRRIIVEGGVDADAVLKLARGLEALR